MLFFEIIIDFVPRDGFLIFSLVSHEWNKIWRMKRRRAVSHIRHFVLTKKLIRLAINSGYSESDIGHAVALHGTKSMLKYILRSKIRFNKKNLCMTLAATGNLDGLKLARKYRCMCGNLACLMASIHGRVNILRWIYKHKYCKIPEIYVIPAVYNCDKKVLTWAMHSGLIYSNACAVAASCGNLYIMQWMKSKGFPWDSNTCANAAEGGHFDILLWARQNGCPWDKETYFNAILNDHFEIAVWALQNGCPTE